MLAIIVDTGALLRVVIYSLALGVGVTVAFSLSILGAVRVAEMRRDGRHVMAGSFAALTILALSIWTLAIILGILELVSKD